MAVEQRHLRVRRRGRLAIVELTGDLDAESEATLNAALTAALALDTPAILLDFSATGYINSTGIALIVGLLKRSRDAGRPLLACGLSEHYDTIFRITRLADFIAVYPDEEAALAAVDGRT